MSPAIAVTYGRGAAAEQRIAGGVQYGFKKVGLRLDGQWLTGDGYRDNGDYDQKNQNKPEPERSKGCGHAATRKGAGCAHADKRQGNDAAY